MRFDVNPIDHETHDSVYTPQITEQFTQFMPC
jgi:hypothetical protein